MSVQTFINTNYELAILGKNESLEDYFYRTHAVKYLPEPDREDKIASAVYQRHVIEARVGTLRGEAIGDTCVEIYRCISDYVPAGYLFSETPAKYTFFGVVRTLPGTVCFGKSEIPFRSREIIVHDDLTFARRDYMNAATNEIKNPECSRCSRYRDLFLRSQSLYKSLRGRTPEQPSSLQEKYEALCGELDNLESSK